MANTFHDNNVSQKNPINNNEEEILSFLYARQRIKLKERYFDKSTGSGFPKYSSN